MRLLFLTQWYSTPSQPGLSRPFEFSRCWACDGHEVTVLCGDRNHLSLRSDRAEDRKARQPYGENGVEVIRVRTHAPVGFGYLPRAVLFGTYALHASALASRLKKPDVILATTPPPTVGVLGVSLSRFWNVPLIVEVRDLWPERLTVAGQLRQGRMAQLMEATLKSAVRWARGVLFVSEGDLKRIRDKGYTGPALVIPHGVDGWMIHQPERRERQAQAPFLTTYAGALGPYNRATDILAAIEILGDPDHFRFDFIGDGDDHEALRISCRSRGIRNVRFLGLLGKMDVFRRLSESDACILVSGSDPHYAEWIPNKVFDYFASGTPMVASAAGDLARLIHRGGGRVTFPEDPEGLANGIRDLAKMSQEKRNRMGETGRRWVLEGFLRSNQARETMEWMERVL